MDSIIYDRHWNGNEWYVTLITIIGIAMIIFLPKRFTPVQTLYNMLIGITLGLVFDHTIEVPPFDYYDLNDQSKFELFDLISYLIYAPFGYWYMYGYVWLRITGWGTIVYLLLWSGVAVLFEWIGAQFGLFHYKHGYQLLYSWPIYLFLMSVQLGLYRVSFAPERSMDTDAYVDCRSSRRHQ